MGRRTVLEVTVGTLVSAVLFGLPGGPAVGGGITGYLTGEGIGWGTLVGGIVGLLSAIAASLFYAAVWVTLLQEGVSRPSVLAELGPTLLLLAVVYGVALGGIGGFAGSYFETWRTSPEPTG